MSAFPALLLGVNAEGKVYKIPMAKYIICVSIPTSPFFLQLHFRCSINLQVPIQLDFIVYIHITKPL